MSRLRQTIGDIFRWPLLLGVLTWLIRVLRAPHTPARIFALALLGVLMMHALVEYPQQYMFFLMPAMLIFGLLETRGLRLVARPVSYGLYTILVLGGLAHERVEACRVDDKKPKYEQEQEAAHRSFV